jgi:hypothetical protein
MISVGYKSGTVHMQNSGQGGGGDRSGEGRNPALLPRLSSGIRKALNRSRQTGMKGIQGMKTYPLFNCLVLAPHAAAVLATGGSGREIAWKTVSRPFAALSRDAEKRREVKGCASNGYSTMFLILDLFSTDMIGIRPPPSGVKSCNATFPLYNEVHVKASIANRDEGDSGDEDLSFSKYPLYPINPCKIAFFAVPFYLNTSPPDHVPSSVREKPRRKPARVVP